MRKKDLDAVYSCVCTKCGGRRPTAEAMPDCDLDGETLRVITELYNGGKKKNDEATANKVAATLAESVQNGYGKSLWQVAWDTPDSEMIRSLQTNVYQFAFAKNYQQLRALSAAMTGSDGKLIPFSEFKDVASRITNQFNQQYLRTEYDTAIGSAQMASRWVQFKNEKELFPNLRYHTVGDSNVRPSHQSLDGVTRPVGDTFWLTYYPPNGWNCRCDVTQQDDSAALTDSDKIITPDDVPKLFKGNLSESGMIFPKGHPYYDHLPDEVLQAAGNNNPFQYDKIYESKSGGYVYDNALHDHGKGWKEKLKTTQILADAGEAVKLLPNLDSKEKWQQQLRKLSLPKGGKDDQNPDAMIGKQTVQFKHGARIDLLLKNSNHAEVLCVRLTEKIKPAALKPVMKNNVLQSQLQEVWVIRHDNKLNKYTRAEIEKF